MISSIANSNAGILTSVKYLNIQVSEKPIHERAIHSPPNLRSYSIPDPRNKRKDRVILRILPERHLIREYDHHDIHRPRRAGPLQRATQQEHAPTLRRRAQRAPNQRQEHG